FLQILSRGISLLGSARRLPADRYLDRSRGAVQRSLLPAAVTIPRMAWPGTVSHTTRAIRGMRKVERLVTNPPKPLMAVLDTAIHALPTEDWPRWIAGSRWYGAGGEEVAPSLLERRDGVCQCRSPKI